MNNPDDKNEFKTYTLAELEEKIESERLQRLQNGVNEGEFRVYFKKSNLTIQIDRNGGNWYEIDLERCTNSDALLDWIFHIHGKDWGYQGGLIAAFLTVLDDCCHEIHGKSAQELFVFKSKANKLIDWTKANQ